MKVIWRGADSRLEFWLLKLPSRSTLNTRLPMRFVITSERSIVSMPHRMQRRWKSKSASGGDMTPSWHQNRSGFLLRWKSTRGGPSSSAQSLVVSGFGVDRCLTSCASAFQGNLLKNPSSGRCLRLSGASIMMDQCNADDLFQQWTLSWSLRRPIRQPLAPCANVLSLRFSKRRCTVAPTQGCWDSGHLKNSSVVC